MPTNFTVVPVKDAKGGSKSMAAAEGSEPGSEPGSLVKIFVDDEDEDNFQEPHAGSARQNFFYDL